MGPLSDDHIREITRQVCESYRNEMRKEIGLKADITVCEIKHIGADKDMKTLKWAIGIAAVTQTALLTTILSLLLRR